MIENDPERIRKERREEQERRIASLVQVDPAKALTEKQLSVIDKYPEMIDRISRIESRVDTLSGDVRGNSSRIKELEDKLKKVGDKRKNDSDHPASFSAKKPTLPRPPSQVKVKVKNQHSDYLDDFFLSTLFF